MMTIKYPNGNTYTVADALLCTYQSALALATQLGGSSLVAPMYPLGTKVLSPDPLGRNWWGVQPDPAIYPHVIPGQFTAVVSFLAGEVGPGSWQPNAIGDPQWTAPVPPTPAPVPPGGAGPSGPAVFTQGIFSDPTRPQAPPAAGSPAATLAAALAALETLRAALVALAGPNPAS